jgi:serine/threonine-protein kinase HipA
VSEHILSVFDGSVRVGTLRYESLEESFAFEYDAAWLVTRSAYSISPHIQMSAAGASSSTVRRFLENLLPEGRALDVVAATNQVSKNNIYGLIRELGKETTGALSFLADEASGVVGRESRRREISRAELKQRIDEREEIPFSVWDGRVRMSIAGYQDKLAVYQDGERMYLVEGELASTHILKPEPLTQRLPMLVANEHFGMSLAARLGLAAAPVSILRVPDAVLMIERFDRVRVPHGVRKVHIIDGCQALNLPVSYKYERNFGSGTDVRDIRDGISFARLFSTVDYTVAKAVTHLALLRWALCQFLLGNSDAHGKNVSFFCRPEGLALAPFYDLVSVVQYAGLDHELAMAYGDEFHLENIRPFDWARFGAQTNTARTLLAREMRRMGTVAPAAAAEGAADAVYVGEEKDLVKSIAEFVARQAAKLVHMAPLVSKVKLD